MGTIRIRWLRPLLGTALAGLALGAILAAWSGSYLEALLFGVEPGDVVTFAGIWALLLAVGVGACLAPAWRAARVEPSVALRGD